MKRLLLPLLAALALPTAVNAEPIPKISDYEFEYKSSEKIKFKCPTKREKNKKTKKWEVTTLYKECWLQLNDDHINIMDRQKINREDIVSYWDFYDDVNAILKHFILYKDKNSQLKELIIKASSKFWTENYYKEHNKVKGKILYWINSK